MLRIGLVLLLGATTIAAEIHPMYYAGQQQSAPEFLAIAVEGVEPKTLPKEEYVATRVRAKVERIFRSKSRIKKGATVEIRYTIFQPREGFTGPRPMPYLKSGERHVFYGRVIERNKEGVWILEPVAGGRSFETVTKEEANL
ncbi:MAG TPA: hypothetical protein PKM44_08755 [Turneriella sp.]|nr:hypothetical protein [Turneriella sp.]HMY10257.1 hypothetical protein [Turneriella sp.]HNA80809.1 hypothetical protein [Turneriella sp.]HNE19123.1 hypothetical protein [Turneriella sp.]HNJ66168.1 hypothetical protein [Turneriella sp.]